jgi:putative tricarboxylic transport membrane protein
VKRVRQLASLVLAGAGVLLVLAGIRLRLEGQYGPGPGFLPFWVGAPLAILSVVWLGQVSLARADGAPPSPASGGVRVASILAALVAFALLLGPLGFTLSMLGPLLFLCFAFDRRHVVAKLIVALAGSVGTQFAFERLLRVPLPSASLPALRSLGF